MDDDPEWQIVVVDSLPIPMPPAERLVEVGVPMAIAVAWSLIRGEMDEHGLRQKAHEARN